jgi:hypothetical protein
VPNFLDEYLVRLGTSVDAAGFARFHNALRESAQIVDANAISMAKSMLKTETELVSGFVAIGGAAVGLADKVAMADQEYRLFGLHMMISTSAARSLKVAMDALGHGLPELSWDPELRKRTSQLIEDQRNMAPTGDYDAQMKKIRDIRFEFTRMEVEVQYLGLHVVQDFMKALGLGPDVLLDKLREFNKWVIENIPQISAMITKYFLPVWKDTLMIMTDVWQVAKDFATVFDDIVGLLSGDDTLKGVVTFDKFAHSVSTVVHWLALVTDFLVKITGLLTGTIAGGTVGGLLGSIIGGIAGIPGGPAGIGAGIIAGGALGTGIGAGAGAIGGGAFDLYRHFAGGSSQSATSAAELAKQVSAKTGIPANLLWDQWAHETGGFSHIAAANNLAGIRLPGSTQYQSFSSLDDFGTRFADILNSRRYAGIGGARDIAAYAHQLKLGGYYEDSEKNYAAGMTRFDRSYPGNAMTIGSVTIQITQQPGESAQDLANRTRAALMDTQNKKIQRNLQEQSNLSWSYGG